MRGAGSTGQRPLLLPSSVNIPSQPLYLLRSIRRIRSHQPIQRLSLPEFHVLHARRRRHFLFRLLLDRGEGFRLGGHFGLAGRFVGAYWFELNLLERHLFHGLLVGFLVLPLLLILVKIQHDTSTGEFDVACHLLFFFGRGSRIFVASIAFVS